MSKLRKPTSNFTMVPNALLRDKSISLKAKGIYALLYSKPDGWTYIEANLIEESNDGRESFRSGMKELAAQGWMTKEQVTDDNGRFSHNDLRLHDQKQKPDDATPVDGKPDDGEPPHIKTEEIKRTEQDLVPPSGSPQRTKATTRESRGQRLESHLDGIEHYSWIMAYPDTKLIPCDWLGWANENVGWGTQRIVDVFNAFRDYWRAQPGQRGVKCDWEATWRNWCRREAQRFGGGSQTQGNRGGSRMLAVAGAVLAHQMARDGMASGRGTGTDGGKPEWDTSGDDENLPLLEGPEHG